MFLFERADAEVLAILDITIDERRALLVAVIRDFSATLPAELVDVACAGAFDASVLVAIVDLVLVASVTAAEAAVTRFPT